jgi:hypothetical protein
VQLAAVTLSAQVDPTNLAMVVLVAVQAVVTWLLLFRKRTAGDAAHHAAEAGALGDLTKAVERITTEVAKLQDWSREHERDDDRLQSRAEEIMRQQTATAADMKQMLANLQRQITNVALGIAPAEAMPVPPSRHHP